MEDGDPYSIGDRIQKANMLDVTQLPLYNMRYLYGHVI